MFSRSLPRAASRLGRFTQCEARPQLQQRLARGTVPWRHIQQPLGRRYKSTLRDQFREQYRTSPIAFPFAIGMIAILSVILVVGVPHYYINVIMKPYHNYPEAVAKHLRRAVYYTRGPDTPDIREGMKYFRKALNTAQELGMDPFSDEIMGIKYMVACIFEENDSWEMAVDVLELMRVDCQRWMDEYGHKHITNGNRSRVRKNMVQVNLKLGQLYHLKYVNEPHNAEKRLVEAVEWALGEKQRREKEGVQPGEGDWMTNEEMGATLEALGNHYEKMDQHYLATPLFLEALKFCPPKSCHSVVLMNNVSISLAQQTPPPASSGAISMSSSPSSFPVTQPPPRAVLLDQARQWANKAIALATEIQLSETNEECNVGCATATHNLGEFFEMEGKINEARQKYDEALSLSKRMRWPEGQANARAGLKRLKELEAKN